MSGAGFYSSSLVSIPAIEYAKILYVDAGGGSDSNDGSSWPAALKTFNQAMTVIGPNSTARGKHYLIVFQGRTTTGNAFTTEQIINVEGVDIIGAGKLYGHGGGHDSCFVAGDPTLYGDKCALKFTVSGCSIRGIKFYQPTEYGPALENYFIMATDPIGLAIEDCHFIGANNNGDITNKYTGGVNILGAEGGYLKHCQFYYCYRGLLLQAGAVRYVTKLLCEENSFGSCDIGIYLLDSYCVENNFYLNRIRDKSTYGFPMTAGIKILTASGNHFIDNRIAVNAAGDQSTKAYTKGSGTNFWNLNYWSSTNSFNQLYAGT
jgi:hypothetical protein